MNVLRTPYCTWTLYTLYPIRCRFSLIDQNYVSASSAMHDDPWQMVLHDIVRRAV